MANLDVQRVTCRIAKHNYERLEAMAERYGVSLNSLMSIIIAQWLDTNHDLKDKVIASLTAEMASRMTGEEKLNFD